MALAVTEYLLPGAYVGEIISPSSGSITADRRVCSYVGRGSRLSRVNSAPIRRSFVTAELLTFSPSAPYVAQIQFPSNGDRASPTRVYDAITGVELRADQWQFLDVVGQLKKVFINTEAYDPTAEYRIDYQSTSRNVKDPLPIDELRSIRAMGSSPGRAQYKDFLDFFIPFSFSGPTAASSNSTTESFLTSINADVSNTGGGSVAISSVASFLHDYTRFYQLTVTAVSGGSGAFQATFAWTAALYSAGSKSSAPVPLHSSQPSPSFICQEAVAASLDVELELGVKVTVAFSPVNFAVGDTFFFNAVGPGKLEIAEKLKAENQFASFSAIAKTGTIGSTGILSYASDNTYLDDKLMHVDLAVTAVSGTLGNRVVTFAWASYGEVLGGSQAVSVTEPASSFTLFQGLKLSVTFGSVHFSIGDKFKLTVTPARSFYQAKDDRVYNLAISGAANPGADIGFVEGTYSTGTVEGNFGLWETEVNTSTGTASKSGIVELPDGICFYVRNAMQGNINGTSYAPTDKFVAGVSNLDFIDWSPTQIVTEIREVSAIKTDVTGLVTGTPGSKYLTLSNAYVGGTVSVVIDSSSIPVSTLEIPGTTFVALLGSSSSALRIKYEFRGEEPAPGQLYFLSAYYLRPKELYNKAMLILSKPEGDALLAPSEIGNHLYIMNKLAFANGAPACNFIQVEDVDGDGVYSVEDFAKGIEAHSANKRSTDLCVLSNFESLNLQLAANERGNDPFQKRWQMLWVGAPIGTPIGTQDTPGSRVALARRTLQTTPTSLALGSRVLVGPTKCKIDLILENNVVTPVTLDGSFVAGALSAVINSFTNPSNDVLRKNVTGFTEIETEDDIRTRILGGASCVPFSDQGNSVFRVEDDITVHDVGDEYHLINQTTQKQYVQKVVEREMDALNVGLIFPDGASAIAAIKANLAGILLGLVGSSVIAGYQQEDGTPRDLDTSKDVIVQRRKGSKTDFDFYFAFFTKFPIKRVFGQYRVNSNDFGNIG